MNIRIASKDDRRFETPLYTAAEAARFLDVPVSTFATWAKGYVRRPPSLATCAPGASHYACPL